MKCIFRTFISDFFLSPMKTAAMDYLSKFFSIKTKRLFYISSSMKSEYLVKIAFFHWCSIHSFHWDKNFRVCEWHTSFQFVHVLFVCNLVSSSVKLRRKKTISISLFIRVFSGFMFSPHAQINTHTHTHNETNYRRIFLWMKKIYLHKPSRFEYHVIVVRKESKEFRSIHNISVCIEYKYKINMIEI